jgi:hypothetical protein
MHTDKGNLREKEFTLAHTVVTLKTMEKTEMDECKLLLSSFPLLVQSGYIRRKEGFYPQWSRLSYLGQVIKPIILESYLPGDSRFSQVDRQHHNGWVVNLGKNCQLVPQIILVYRL